MLAVQPQEAGAGQGRIAHSQHCVDCVPEEGQLAHGLCRQTAGLVEKLLSPSTLAPPSWVPPSPLPGCPPAPDPLMKLICASWELHPCSCLSSRPIRLFTVAMFICHRCCHCCCLGK